MSLETVISAFASQVAQLREATLLRVDGERQLLVGTLFRRSLRPLELNQSSTMQARRRIYMPKTSRRSKPP